MNPADFSTEYEHKADDELLYLFAQRTELTPEAVAALENEVRNRGLKTQNAVRLKSRMDRLAERERKGSLRNQVVTAKYEHSMRHFVGTEEPEFVSPYGSRDIRRTLGYIQHKYRVWKAFRDHTGHWPVLSIWYGLLSWIPVVALIAAVVMWVERHDWGSVVCALAIIGCGLCLVWLRSLGERYVRRVDWQRYGLE